MKGFRRDWLEPETREAFDEKVKCIEKNVDEFEVEVTRLIAIDPLIIANSRCTMKRAS